MEEEREKIKEYFDSHHTIRYEPLKVGDKVLVFNSKDSKPRKLQFPWMGPYTVAEPCGNGAYFLASEDGVRMAIPIAGNRIKKFTEREKGTHKETHMMAPVVPMEPRQKAMLSAPLLDGEKDDTPGPIEDEPKGVVTRGEAKRRLQARKAAEIAQPASFA